MTTRASQEGVHTAPEVAYPADKKETNQVERVLSAEDGKVDHVNYDRIDAEVAKYAEANAEAVHISEEENKRLKRLIDRRVLPVMVFTYFLQSLDKGTMSFSSIMGIRNDIPILKQNYYVSRISQFTTRGHDLLTFHSGDGSPRVSTLPFSLSNIPSTLRSNAFPSRNSSLSTSCAGPQYYAATLCASVSPPLLWSEPYSESSKLFASLHSWS